MHVRENIRNVAIIAHVDHGKTTLVDALLKQSRIFRENQEVGNLIMDSNALEREKGITIMAKNTAVEYQGIKINIIDTPGHADFSGEVERVISMADGCLLMVDSVEGPMPQTKFVLRHALRKGLKTVVVINKMDRPDRRPEEVIRMTQDLFLELATDADQLDFPVIYASARDGIASWDKNMNSNDISPVFEAILKHIPPPRIEAGPFQMMVSNLSYDNHKGRISIGRIWRGTISEDDRVAVVCTHSEVREYEVAEVFTYLGLKQVKVESAEAGDIVALSGIDNVSIGDTLADVNRPEALPRIEIGEPTVEMTFGVNTSPFRGREGKYCTSRHLRERLYRELDTNLSLRVQDSPSPDTFIVKGRGELHLSILIETMRREGYEFEVSKPKAIIKTIDGKQVEPVELLTIDTGEEYIGVLTETLSKRQARMIEMHNGGNGAVRIVFQIPTKGLIGFRSIFLTSTRGESVMNTVFMDFQPVKGEINSSRSGVLVASEEGNAITYGLNNAQGRGITFIEPGTHVYEGMIVGLNSRQQDIPVNVCKEKKKTNVRASTADIAIKLTPPVIFSLEQSIDFINNDELVEVTPKNIRLRKKTLRYTDRLRSASAASKQAVG
ncbi:MAG: translational GTPase TypA [Dehalococcoidales bacterium]|nr:translational GTPase TypA [Dehalococcoidales bacterium]